MLGGIRKLITFCLVAVISLASVGGVWATWHYAATPIDPTSTAIDLTLSPWKGIEILPTETEDGANHLSMIEALKADLNKGSRSTVQDLIDDRMDDGRTEFGTMAMTGGNDLGGVISGSTENVSMLISFSEQDKNTYYVFTTSVPLGHRGASRWRLIGGDVNTAPGIHYFWNGAGEGDRIYEIYRTKMIKVNGVWQADVVDVGSALPCWYEENQGSGEEHVTQIPSFDPSTYKTISELPIATKDNPAFTYLSYSVSYYNDNASSGNRGKVWVNKGYEGQTVKAFPSTDRTENWYTLQPEMASGTTSGTVTLTLADGDKDMNLTVYAGNKSTVITTNDGGGTVSFTAQAGTTYFVSVSGDVSIEYTVSFTAN